MKKRNLFITLGLALGLGVAATAGLAQGKEAVEVDAATGWKVFYVYVEGNVTDYYDSSNSYNWLENSWDAIEANLYNKTTQQACTEVGGTLMKRVSPKVVGIGINDTVDADALELYNCYTDNKDIRNRSTWNGATPIVFDISQYNTFSIVKFNCPTGTDSGSFNMNYSWKLDVQTGSDADITLEYDFAENKFQKKGIELSAGTTFKIIDSLSNEVTVGESGTGSAFTDGSISSYSAGVYTVVKSGVYDLYANTNGNSVWIENNAEQTANSWAEDFVKNVGCKSPYNAAPAKWSEYALDWAKLTNGAKWKFIEVTASNEEGASYLQQAAFIHDMCVSKYDGCDVFMEYSDGTGHHSRTAERFVENTLKVNSDNIVPLISIISMTAVVAVGGIFLLRRKEN